VINEAAIIAIVASVTGADSQLVAELRQSSRIPGWDSLAHLRLFLALEEERIPLPEMDAIADLDSIDKILAYVSGMRRPD
jgi:acyl carrier protein